MRGLWGEQITNPTYGRVFSLINIILLMLLISFCNPIHAGTQKHIALVLNEDKKLHRNTADDLRQQLSQRNIISQPFPLTHDLSAIVKDTDLFVTLGEHASRNVLELDRKLRSDKPILALLISRQTHDQLAQYHRNQRFLSITLDQPIPRQIRETRRLMPKQTRFGTVLSPDWTQHEKVIKTLAGSLYQSVTIEYAHNDDEALQKINQVLEQSDVFLAFNNSLFRNRFITKKLLYLAHRQKKPVVGFSPSFTSAGAIAAIFTERPQLIQDTLAFIENFLHNPHQFTQSHAYPPQSYTVKFNHSVRSHLAVDIDTRREGPQSDDTPY